MKNRKAIMPPMDFEKAIKSVIRPVKWIGKGGSASVEWARGAKAGRTPEEFEGGEPDARPVGRGGVSSRLGGGPH